MLVLTLFPMLLAVGGREPCPGRAPRVESDMSRYRSSSQDIDPRSCIGGVVAPLLLALGSVSVLVGLMGHFAGHPDQLARPWLILSRIGMVPTVLSHLSKHPSTILGVVGVLLFSIGVILMTVRRRSQTGG